MDSRVVDALGQPATPGGDPYGACTAGFVVEVNGTSNRGLATAGHCVNEAQYAGFLLNFKGERYRDKYDVQWMDHPNITWNARFRSSYGYTREVHDRMSYGNMDVGDPVCKYGKITGFKCGEIVDNTICPSYVTSCDSTFVQAHNNDGLDMCDGGDSGGPAFLGSTAIGFTSGFPNSDPNDAWYMPPQFVNFFDLHVDTVN